MHLRKCRYKMIYKEINVDRIINKIVKKDNLFSGNYTVDPYQNCEFRCKYCDSSYSDTIFIKKNAVEIFEKDIKNIDKGRIIIGSVHDPYQFVEKKYRFTRKILKIIKKNNFPVNIITKSNYVLDDIDLISDIDDSIITISIISLDKNITNIFEKNLPDSYERLAIIKKISEKNIKTILAIIPILPYITDKEINKILLKADEYKAYKIVFKTLELKGDQKQLFFNIIKDKYPELFKKYKKIYNDSFQPDDGYINKINKILNEKIK